MKSLLISAFAINFAVIVSGLVIPNGNLHEDDKKNDYCQSSDETYQVCNKKTSKLPRGLNISTNVTVDNTSFICINVTYITDDPKVNTTMTTEQCANPVANVDVVGDSDEVYCTSLNNTGNIVYCSTSQTVNAIYCGSTECNETNTKSSIFKWKPEEEEYTCVTKKLESTTKCAHPSENGKSLCASTDDCVQEIPSTQEPNPSPSSPGSTESSDTTHSGSTESSDTTHSGSTESSDTTESGSTESSDTTESGSTESSSTEPNSRSTQKPNAANCATSNFIVLSLMIIFALLLK